MPIHVFCPPLPAKSNAVARPVPEGPKEFRSGNYACFHTGPSATADIEGVLIHGAQGVCSLSVASVGSLRVVTKPEPHAA